LFIVTLELRFDFFVCDRVTAFKVFALFREAVYVLLPWDEVLFNVARCLLVAVDSDHALRAWDFHAKLEFGNGRLKLVD
jgi:hypothetical protein